VLNTPTDLGICKGEVINLNQPQTSYIFIAPNTGFTASADSTQFFFSPTATTDYQLFGYVGGGCEAKDTVEFTITVDQLPTASFEMVDSACGNSYVEIIFNGTGDNITTFDWQFDNPGILNGAGAGPYQLMWQRAGIQTVHVDVKTQNGCTDSYSEQIVTIQPEIETIADATITLGESIQLWGDAAPLFNKLMFQWTPNIYLDCDTCQHPYATPLNTTNYSVVVTDTWGCIDTAAVKITIDKNRTVNIPNAFTPNADGNNDRFVMYGDNIQNMQLSIYSRWGEKVFETTDIKTGWDGTFKGKSCSPGVYVYVVQITYIDAFSENRQGNFTLLK
jgi:gliding motility-associated-like protein